MFFYLAKALWFATELLDQDEIQWLAFGRLDE